MNIGVAFSFLAFVSVNGGSKERFQLIVYQAVKNLDKNVFVSRCEMLLGDEVVEELEGEGGDPFGAVYTVLHQAKLRLMEQEVRLGYQFYYEGFDGRITDQKIDLELNFSGVV